MQYLPILTSIGMQSIKSLHFYDNKLDHIPDDQPISKGGLSTLPAQRLCLSGCYDSSCGRGLCAFDFLLDVKTQNGGLPGTRHVTLLVPFRTCCRATSMERSDYGAVAFSCTHPGEKSGLYHAVLTKHDGKISFQTNPFPVK